MNLFALLESTARRRPGRGAAYLGEREVLTYGALYDQALRLAALMRLSCQAGDRVAVAANNRPEYLSILFGAWAAGLVVVPLNAKLHPREMLDILSDSGARLIFASAKHSKLLTPLVADDVRILDLDAGVMDDLAQLDPAVPATVGPDDLAWLFFTSGTTGRSKGAMLSHRNLLAMTAAYLADFDSVEAHHHLIHAAPMSHGSGLYALPYVARGAGQVIPTGDGFDPLEFIALASRYEDTAAFLAPTMVQRLRLASEDTGLKPERLRTVVYGGGPMYVEELRRARAAFGPVFIQLFGQGEAPMTITGLRRSDHETDDDAVLGSVGWARTGVEVAIFDDQDRALPSGEAGEIVCRGDVVMSGYWNAPDATAATLRSGWLHTGDIGVMDVTGRVTLRDRSKDVIISGGTNIYPREVEEVLLRHPGVLETAVIGAPDPEWGESIAAFIVRAPDSVVSEAELDALCLSSIARFKRPKSYHFIPALPKSSYGKVLKRELVDLLSEPV